MAGGDVMIGSAMEGGGVEMAAGVMTEAIGMMTEGILSTLCQPLSWSAPQTCKPRIALRSCCRNNLVGTDHMAIWLQGVPEHKRPGIGSAAGAAHA